MNACCEPQFQTTMSDEMHQMQPFMISCSSDKHNGNLYHHGPNKTNDERRVLENGHSTRGKKIKELEKFVKHNDRLPTSNKVQRQPLVPPYPEPRHTAQ